MLVICQPISRALREARAELRAGVCYWVEPSTGKVVASKPTHGRAVIDNPEAFGITDEADLEWMRHYDPERPGDCVHAADRLVNAGKWARAIIAKDGWPGVTGKWLAVQARDTKAAQDAVKVLEDNGLNLASLGALRVDLGRLGTAVFDTPEKMADFVVSGVSPADFVR